MKPFLDTLMLASGRLEGFIIRLSWIKADNCFREYSLPHQSRPKFCIVPQCLQVAMKTRRGIILSLILLGIIAHVFALQGSFKTMDDEMTIVNNDRIKSLRHFKEILTESFFGGGTYYRPAVTLSHLLEYHLVGLNPFFYYLTNLLLHLGNSIVLFFIFQIFLKKDCLSFAAALLFAVHPLQGEAVSNIAGRSNLLCAFGYLTAFLFHVHYVEKKRPCDLVFAVIFFLLALLSKEPAVTLPAVFVCFEMWGHRQRKNASQTLFSREAVLRLLPYFLWTAGYLLLRRFLGIANMIFWPSLKMHVLGSATFLRGVMTYLRLFFLPVDLHFDRAVAYFTSFADTQLWATVLVMMTLIGVVWTFRRRWSRRVKFFFAWFWLTLLPTAQIVPLPAHAGYAALAEHFLYLPLAGLIAITVLVCSHVFRMAHSRGLVSWPVIRFMCAGFFVYFILIAIGQSVQSARELAMFEKSLRYNPRNTRVRISYALALAKVKLFQEAEGEFRKVLGAEPWDVRARIGLGKALCDQGKCLEAIDEYERITDAGSMNDLLQTNLSYTYEVVIAQYKNRIAREPRNAPLYYSLGIMYARLNRTGEAVAQYKKGVRLSPRERPLLYNLAAALETQGRFKEAVFYFRRVIALAEETGAGASAPGARGLTPSLLSARGGSALGGKEGGGGVGVTIGIPTLRRERRESVGTQHPAERTDALTEYSYQHLGYIYQRLGERHKAQKYFQKAGGMAANLKAPDSTR
jgi:tetratricopeptide (TPR) repeat protein